jgi:hypothetical protein
MMKQHQSGSRSRTPCVHFIGSDATITPLPRFQIARRVAGRPSHGEGLPRESSLTLHAAASRDLATASIACPRKGWICGDVCVECQHLLAWQLHPAIRLCCAVDGDDPVTDWMSRRPVCVSASARCGDADHVAALAHAHHVIVVDGGGLVGVACRCELARGVDAPVHERISREVFAAAPSTSLRLAIAAMKQLAIACIPVLDGERVVGILTRMQLVRAGIIAHQLPGAPRGTLS